MMTECARRRKDISIHRMCFAIGSFICCTFVYIEICISLSHLNNTRFKNQFNSTELSGLIFTNLYSTKKSKWEKKNIPSVGRCFRFIQLSQYFCFIEYLVNMRYFIFCFCQQFVTHSHRNGQTNLNSIHVNTQRNRRSCQSFFLKLFLHSNLLNCVYLHVQLICTWQN